MIEYVNAAAVAWLTFYIVYNAHLLNSNIGRRVIRVNMVPLIISIASLVTLGIAIVRGF